MSKETEIKVLRRNGLSYDKIAKTLHISKSKAYEFGRDVKVSGAGKVDAVQALRAELKRCKQELEETVNELEDMAEKNSCLTAANTDLSDELRRLERKNRNLASELEEIERLKSQRDRFSSDAVSYRAKANKYEKLYKKKADNERVSLKQLGKIAGIVQRCMRELETDHESGFFFWSLRKRLNSLELMNSFVKEDLKDLSLAVTRLRNLFRS